MFHTGSGTLTMNGTAGIGSMSSIVTAFWLLLPHRNQKIICFFQTFFCSLKCWRILEAGLSYNQQYFCGHD